jgi:hypothetical protein
MNLYHAARTKRSTQVVTRWTAEIHAESQAEAVKKARQQLKPKAGQAVWVKFIRLV